MPTKQERQAYVRCVKPPKWTQSTLDDLLTIAAARRGERLLKYSAGTTGAAIVVSCVIHGNIRLKPW